MRHQIDGCISFSFIREDSWGVCFIEECGGGSGGVRVSEWMGDA